MPIVQFHLVYPMSIVILQIFRCLMELNDTNLKEFSKAAATGERVDLRSPIKEADYKAHAGSVYGLDCSPFQVRVTRVKEPLTWYNGRLGFRRILRESRITYVSLLIKPDQDSLLFHGPLFETFYMFTTLRSVNYCMRTHPACIHPSE